jgi:hypothetical protein
MNNFDNAFARLISKVDNYFKEAPKVIATLAVRHYRDSFRNSGFTDDTLERWTPLKPSYRPGAIPLVKTGQLRGSVRASTINRNVVQIIADRPYAEYHNKGLGNNPLRKFIGESNTLNNLLKSQLSSLVRKTIS